MTARRRGAAACAGSLLGVMSRAVTVREENRIGLVRACRTIGLRCLPMTQGMSTALPLEGLTVVVTGEITGLDRDQAKAGVEALGGKPSGSVSGRTGLVVAGIGAGVSKMQKVKQFGTPTLTGERFAALLDDPSTWQGLEAEVAATLADQPEIPVVVEPYVAPDHMVTCGVVYPGGVRDVRLSCSCGNKWKGVGVLDRELGCPKDPDGYPRQRSERAQQTQAAA